MSKDMLLVSPSIHIAARWRLEVFWNGKSIGGRSESGTNKCHLPTKLSWPPHLPMWRCHPGNKSTRHPRMPKIRPTQGHLRKGIKTPLPPHNLGLKERHLRPGGIHSEIRRLLKNGSPLTHPPTPPPWRRTNPQHEPRNQPHPRLRRRRLIKPYPASPLSTPPTLLSPPPYNPVL